MKKEVLLILSLFLVVFIIPLVNGYGLEKQFEIIEGEVYTCYNNNNTLVDCGLDTLKVEEKNNIKIEFDCGTTGCMRIYEKYLGWWSGGIKLTYNQKEYLANYQTVIPLYAFQFNEQSLYKHTFLTFNPVLVSKDNSTFVGEIKIFLGDYQGEEYGYVNIAGNIIENQYPRISLLESFQKTISTTINTILTTLTGHTTKLDEYGARITALENGDPNTPQNNTSISFPNYFKYLSKSDREDMLCGYAEENNMNSITDLGLTCALTYKPYLGGQKATCKCEKHIPGGALISAPLFLSSFSAKTSGLTLDIGNAAGEKLVIKEISVTNCGSITPKRTLYDGSSYPFRIYCKLGYNTNFNGDITVTYNKIGSSLDLTSIGIIQTKIS